MERTITWRRRWATRSWQWPCRSCPRCPRAGARPRSPSRRGKSRPRPARREAPAPKSRTTRIGTSSPRHPNLVRGVASPVRREPVSGREDRRERGKFARENRTRTRLDARGSAPVASRRSGTRFGLDKQKKKLTSREASDASSSGVARSITKTPLAYSRASRRRALISQPRGTPGLEASPHTPPGVRRRASTPRRRSWPRTRLAWPAP